MRPPLICAKTNKIPVILHISSICLESTGVIQIKNKQWTRTIQVVLKCKYSSRYSVHIREIKWKNVHVQLQVTP